MSHLLLPVAGTCLPDAIPADQRKNLTDGPLVWVYLSQLFSGTPIPTIGSVKLTDVFERILIVTRLSENKLLVHGTASTQDPDYTDPETRDSKCFRSPEGFRGFRVSSLSFCLKHHLGESSYPIGVPGLRLACLARSADPCARIFQVWWFFFQCIFCIGSLYGL